MKQVTIIRLAPGVENALACWAMFEKLGMQELATPRDTAQSHRRCMIGRIGMSADEVGSTSRRLGGEASR